METSTQQRGRKTSRDSTSTLEEESTPMASVSGMDDSGFGVHSLEDAISSTFSSDTSLSRTNSNTTEQSTEAGAETGGLNAGRKRKAGNPVHPKIAATGQRILSSEYNPSLQASVTGSPVSIRSAESPFRTPLRRGSASSSINLSQPLTPLKMSPQPVSATLPSTPRSGSPKSFRLSDEEASLASETGSQAVQSASGEEEEEEDDGVSKSEAMPQLVMPSIAMPTRRPFTEKGRRMGRLKVMVVGPRGVGKTSLIQSICRACEDIVHMDPISGTTLSHSPVIGSNEITATKKIVEIGASTRSYPSWWDRL